MIRTSLIIINILLTFSCFSQNQKNDIIYNIKYYKFENALSSVSKYPIITQKNIKWQIEFIKKFNQLDYLNQKYLELQKPKDIIGQFYYYINIGDYFFYFSKNKSQIALKNYQKALKIANENKNLILECEALKKILTIHRLIYLYQNETYISYLNRYKKIAYDDYEKAYWNYFNLILNFKNYFIDKWDYNSYNSLKKFLNENKTPFLAGISNIVFASYFEEKNQIDSVWYYINKSELNFDNFNNEIKIIRTNQLNTFKSRIALSQKKVAVAKSALSKVQKRDLNLVDYTSKALTIFYESVIDTINNDYKSAYKKYLTYEAIADTVRDLRYNLELNDLNTKYQTAEKEKENLKLESQKRQITIGLSSTLLLGSIIAFLVYRNTKRKQHIAEQDRELQIQKTESILKEKEIETINAMVSGQEKERLRLAGELHDNLGSTLATVRMQVENLERNLDKVDDPKELLKKTNALVNEAYDKVRRISHERNSGVMAKDGLLPAIQKLAHTVSNANNLTVDVQDFGLENRIANELEITIFRIIQELVTNIVKHAQASEANISLTQHDNELNIMVEDNGKGFKVSALKEKEGMGLGNIERRIEHLEGSMEVDSTPERGTSISIDIPL